MTTTISIELTGTLRNIVAALTDIGRAALNEAMGAEVQVTTVAHLRELAANRHATAERLGASPSNFLAQAADKVESPAALSAGSIAATLTLNHPGIGRAFHSITIVPVEAKALAIPIAAIAYNRRPGQFSNLFVFKSKTTGNAFLAQRQAEKTDKPLLLYLLVRSVTQRQDRTLLPSNEEWEAAASLGARNYIRTALAAGGNL